MQRLLVLGAGTAGTMIAHTMRRRRDADQWQITVVDRDDEHHYQPGYLFIPFGRYSRDQVVRARRPLLPAGVELVLDEIDAVDAEAQAVTLRSGRRIDYDYLVIATGSSPRPEQTPGMLGPQWRRKVFDFYTLDGALALNRALESFDRGTLVIHVTEMPIKCPVAPLEFAFLADAWFRSRGTREQMRIVYVTPQSGAFTRPTASALLGSMLDERGIDLETDFMVERVDGELGRLVSYDDRTVAFDLLVTVPVNMGADYVARSGLGDELNQVPVDRHTLQSRTHPSVFALGDAADLPTSKAGSVVHFSVDVVVENLLAQAAGRPLPASFDGHANCFVESGDRKGLLVDFNYDVEPLPGRYPLPGLGPFSLLRATRLNHLGKLAFRWFYWHLLLPARPLPVPARMSLAGKQLEKKET